MTGQLGFILLDVQELLSFLVIMCGVYETVEENLPNFDSVYMSGWWNVQE
jgi:hypothetical protein